MPLIAYNTLPTANLKGEEHGASISLILDDSAPGQDRASTATPTTRPGSSSTETSPSTAVTSGSPPAPATSSSSRPIPSTSSPTTAPDAPSSSASTPTRPWSPNCSNEPTTATAGSLAQRAKRQPRLGQREHNARRRAKATAAHARIRRSVLRPRRRTHRPSGRRTERAPRGGTRLRPRRHLTHTREHSRCAARFLIVRTPAGFEHKLARRAAAQAGVDPPAWAKIPDVTNVGPRIGEHTASPRGG